MEQNTVVIGTEEYNRLRDGYQGKVDDVKKQYQAAYKVALEEEKARLSKEMTPKKVLTHTERILLAMVGIGLIALGIIELYNIHCHS